MMKRFVVFLALLVAACSSGAPSAEQQQIVALEQEKAQLETQLKEARANVAKLQAVIARGGSSDGGAEEAPAGPVAPQPVDPQPASIPVGQAGDAGAQSGGNRSIE